MSQPSSPAPLMGSPNAPSASSKRRGTISTNTVLLLLFTNAISFLLGTTYASRAALATTTINNIPNQRERQLPGLPEKQLRCPPPRECPACPKLSCPEPAEVTTTTAKTTAGDNINPFPPYVRRFAAGLAFTTQQNFTKTYDLGVPIDKPKVEGETGVVLLYNTPESLPPGYSAANAHKPMSAQKATQNCDQLNVVLSYHEGQRRQCTAIVPQYESFHIQKWMRVPEEGRDGLGSNQPLRLVPRGQSLNGQNAFHVPHHEKHTKKHWKMLEAYLESIDDVLNELKPLVTDIKRNNAIVVMVCNFGQSQLLLNFACAAKAKGIDTTAVLVFATDLETKELAQSVGLNVYFDQRNFGNMPKKAAKVYGDGAFTNMMLSKVICVHMAMLLGVDVLFQDVDIIWYKHPLDYFHKDIEHTPMADFDAYFQDDGSRSLRFAPYCANSGFYYFRNNDKTRYFMTSLLMQSDLILRSFSHQSVLISLLAEHSSLLGLTVKVLDPFVFPAGFIYHRKRGRGPYGDYMMELFEGKQDPYIFHMSWTENKHNKILFYRQTDQWYLQDKCMDTELASIEGVERNTFVEGCCAAEPLFSCHFKDKPSTHPCKDSPALDKNGASYW